MSVSSARRCIVNRDPSSGMNGTRRFGNTSLEVSASALGCGFSASTGCHRTHDDLAIGGAASRLDRKKQKEKKRGTFFDNGDAYARSALKTFGIGCCRHLDRSRVEIGSKFGYDFYVRSWRAVRTASASDSRRSSCAHPSRNR